MADSAFPLSYRQEETAAIFRGIKAGDSGMIVGAKGIGKTNLLRHVVAAATRQEFLKKEWRHYLFCTVVANALPDAQAATLYTQIGRGLLEEAKKAKLLEGASLRQAQRRLDGLERSSSSQKRADARNRYIAFFETLAQNERLHAVILFDEIEAVYQQIPADAFATLREVRDHYIKHRISYFTFTHQELDRLDVAPGKEKFNQLLAQGTIWLGPCRNGDARLSLERLARRYGEKVDPVVGERLIQLSGRHHGILKATWLATNDDPIQPGDEVDALLNNSKVRQECANLWKSLGPEEQSVLASATRAGDISDAEALADLKNKRLIAESGEVFSPLFARFIARQSAPLPDRRDRPSTAAAPRAKPTLRIEDGLAWWDDRRLNLAPNEFKLLEVLCEHRGKVCGRETILRHVYPDEFKRIPLADDSVPLGNDARVDTVVSRLRKEIEAAGGDPKAIETVRGRGYILNGEGHSHAQPVAGQAA